MTFGCEGGTVQFTAEQGSYFLLLSGKPLDEPVIGYGPLVMNTRKQINQALDDFKYQHFPSIE